jgi:trimeric autotransporter adhesin
MFDARRPMGRLFYLLVTLAIGLAALGQTPATTTISDIVYRADGTPAGGTLLISWPAFITASGQAIAAGNTSVTLGTGGTLNVALVPNVNATPANTVYSVVYQLNDPL